MNKIDTTVIPTEIDKGLDPWIKVIPKPRQLPLNERFRNLVTNFENKLKTLPGVMFDDCFPLNHIFAEGLYIREISVPKGFIVVTYIHKQSHPCFIMKGECSVFTEEGIKRLKGPMPMITRAGTKRVIYVHEDTIWITVHPNPTNTMNLKDLKEQIHTKDYDDLHSKMIDVKGETVQEVFEEFIKQADSKGEYMNCGLTALSNLSDLKNASMRTLVNLAEDNGIKLFPRKIPLDELSLISCPAILHAKDHFVFYNQNELEELEYSGNVLLTKDSEYPQIEEDLSSIKGASGAMIAAGAIFSGALGAGASAYGANVSAETQRDLARQNEELWGGQLYKQLPDYAESAGARGEWWNRLQQWGQDPNYGAISPAWDEMWDMATKKVQDYYGGTATTPGLNAKIKASAARRGVSQSPALEEILTRSGIDQGSQIKNLASQEAISKAQFGENARQNWMTQLMGLSQLKPAYMTRTGVTSGGDNSAMWGAIGNSLSGVSSRLSNYASDQNTLNYLQNYLDSMGGAGGSTSGYVPGQDIGEYDFSLGNANYGDMPSWAQGLSFN